MSRLQLTSDGFTIIELLVAMVLFVFLMISMMTMYKESVSMNRELDATRILQKNARDVVEKIAKDIRDYGVMSTGNGFFTGEVLQIQG